MLASVADCLQAMAAAWRGKRPRVANALITQATTRLSAASTRQRLPAPSCAPHFLFLGLFALLQQQLSASLLCRHHSLCRLTTSRPFFTAAAPLAP